MSSSYKILGPDDIVQIGDEISNDRLTYESSNDIKWFIITKEYLTKNFNMSVGYYIKYGWIFRRKIKRLRIG